MTVVDNWPVCSIQQQNHFKSDPFPLVLDANSMSDSLNWIKSNSEALKLELSRNGAILFRNFLKGNSPQSFYEFAHEALGVDALPYVGGAAPRNTVYKDVHTTNESPPNEPIPFHHEMAQVPLYPKQLLFYCDLAPTVGGETPILQSDVIFDRVNAKYPLFVQDLIQKGVVYWRVNIRL